MKNTSCYDEDQQVHIEITSVALSSHEADKQCMLLHPSCFYMKIRYLMAVNKGPRLQQVTVNAVTNFKDILVGIRQSG
jgi:hypothetical protein